MSSIRCLALFCSTVAWVSGCYTLKIGQNTSLSHSTWLGMSGSVRDEYKKPPAVDPSKYVPAGGPMTVDTSQGTPLELDFSIEFRRRLTEHFFTGLTSNYLSSYFDGSNPGLGLSGFYRQNVRYSIMNWWDPVLAENVVIKRSPSIGFTLGFMLDAPKSYERVAEKQVVQYSVSIRRYELDVNSYEGIDCVNCRNTSRVINTAVISSGAGWRQTLELGTELFRLGFWFEFDGKTQITTGIGFAISPIVFGKD